MRYQFTKRFRITCLIIALFAQMTFSAFAISSDEYDSNMDYMTEMRLAAEDGSEQALRYGTICEINRNLKIRDLDLDYEETYFFRPNRSAEDILSDITEYIENHRRIYLGTYWITGYTISYEDCGKIDGITRSGVIAEVGRTCASGTEFDFGTKLYIEGLGERVVEDRGGKVKNGYLDILFETKSECYAATGWYDVWLIQ